VRRKYPCQREKVNSHYNEIQWGHQLEISRDSDELRDHGERQYLRTEHPKRTDVNLLFFRRSRRNALRQAQRRRESPRRPAANEAP